MRHKLTPCVVAVFLTLGCCAAADEVDPSTLDNKVLVGYQGWFTCPQDGTGRWTHWSRGVPTPETLTIDLYPDLREFEPDELCEIPGMTIGERPAYLFSSRNAKSVRRHFQWMKEYGLDGVLVQRFVGEIRGKRAGGEVVLKNIMAAAEEFGRTFAIEYDISGGNPETFAQILKEDWAYLVDEVKVTAHPFYQHHNGKPLVSVWGMGLNDSGHPPADPDVALELIQWFKANAPEQHRVTYMGGTPARWGTLSRDSRTDPKWAEVYAAMDIVQPWNVGRYGTLEAVDRWKTEVLEPDVKLAADNGQLYMPVVFPGFSWHNLKQGAPQNQIPRLSGEFLWRQAYNAKTAGAKVLKIAMFDEVDEATAIMKAAPRRSDAPEQGYWLTLDADGAELPSDWYLRLSGEITRMFHGDLEPDAALPKNPGPQPPDATLRKNAGPKAKNAKKPKRRASDGF
ncbi:MAG TPA: glycoside hydrolase family 71/99-like protein [Bryobacteraceae bacterium]|nr:glycoside hydrolase family 71/99-like protein [Bryobacteraceae bacterium]